MPAKLKSNQAAHISHSFYFLTACQAKRIAEENILPRNGYERRANPSELRSLVLGKIERCPLPGDYENCRFRAFDGRVAVEGWITRTPLSWWNDTEVEDGQVWALHVTKYQNS